MMNGIGRSSADQVFHEWQVDSLDPAQTNTQIEGDDAPADAFTATVRVGNYCQISRKVVQVSGTSQASDQAGRANELSYQIVKRGKELKRKFYCALAA